MYENTPVVRQSSWVFVILQLLVLGFLVLVGFLLFGARYSTMSLVFGPILYLAYGRASRWFLLRHQRRGMQLTDRCEFASAIQEFGKSYEFFSKYLWVDQYRYLTMLTPAKQTFREMALVNTAYCYTQLGDGEQAQAYYQRTLNEFPDSMMAKTALNLLDTAENN